MKQAAREAPSNETFGVQQVRLAKRSAVMFVSLHNREVVKEAQIPACKGFGE
jgi:hypothetical protein